MQHITAPTHTIAAPRTGVARRATRAASLLVAVLALVLVLAAPADAHVVWSPKDSRSIHPNVVSNSGLQPTTWYGPGFYGRRTACGRTMSPSLLGVAHKTLPCGTRVTVFFAGRAITVPVVDRGPFVEGVAYDLTSATAHALGFAGRATVGVEAVQASK